eukprot:63013-Amorphochlora_amoeboformis.AAC.1
MVAFFHGVLTFFHGLSPKPDFALQLKIWDKIKVLQDTAGHGVCKVSSGHMANDGMVLVRTELGCQYWIGEGLKHALSIERKSTPAAYHGIAIARTRRERVRSTEKQGADVLRWRRIHGPPLAHTPKQADLGYHYFAQNGHTPLYPRIYICPKIIPVHDTRVIPVSCPVTGGVSMVLFGTQQRSNASYYGKYA